MNAEPRDDLRELASQLKDVAEAAFVKTEPASGLSADEPIRSTDEDRLNRSGFARELARALVASKRTESLVVGIHGRWGTGKTSLLNLIHEQMERVSEQPPVVFRFNPWAFSDQEQLATQFFEELSTFLRLHRTIPSLADISDTVREYGQLLSPLARALFPLATEAVRTGWRLFGRLAPPKKGAAELKGRISAALLRSGLKVILVVDDLDRLNASEIRQAFQLIKVDADFSNTIYLVAFDKRPVEKALETVAPGPANEYLEKIVQVSFNLPPISAATLSEIMLSDFNSLLPTSGALQVDTQRFGNMFHAGFRSSFQTIRDANRYFNVFRFALNLIGEDTNFIDLAAIQALSLFYSDLHTLIEQNSDMFAGAWRTSERPDREKLRHSYDKIFGAIPEDKRPPALSLCRFLFPKVEYIYGSTNTFWGTDFIREWEKEKRVCTEKYFRYYFELAVPDTDVSQAELDRALESASELNAFVVTLQRLKDTGRLGPFVDLLRNNIEKLSRDQMLVILESIFVFGDDVPSEGSSIFYGTLSEHVRFATWLLFDLLDRLGDDRFGRLLQFMSARHPAIFTITNTAAMLDRILQDTTNPERREQKQKYPDLTADVVKSTKTAAVWAIEHASDHGRLASVPHLPFVLARWAEWGDPNRVKDWVSRTFLQTPESAIQLASSFSHEITSMGISDRVPKVRTVIAVKSVAEFVDIERLTSLILEAKDSNLTEEERLTKRRYLAGKQKFDAGIDPASPAGLMDED
jgi:predicted KAP-like P-loop ATPase